MRWQERGLSVVIWTGPRLALISPREFRPRLDGRPGAEQAASGPARGVPVPAAGTGLPAVRAQAREDAACEQRASGDPGRGAAGLQALSAARAAALSLCATADRAALQHGTFLDKILLRSRTGYVAIDRIRASRPVLRGRLLRGRPSRARDPPVKRGLRAADRPATPAGGIRPAARPDAGGRLRHPRALGQFVRAGAVPTRRPVTPGDWPWSGCSVASRADRRFFARFPGGLASRFIGSYPSVRCVLAAPAQLRIPPYAVVDLLRCTGHPCASRKRWPRRVSRRVALWPGCQVRWLTLH